MFNKLILSIILSSFIFVNSFNLKSTYKSNSKNSVLFFPGNLNKPLPSELYSTFLSLINKNEINVFVSQDEDTNFNVLDSKLSDFNNCIVAHSFSANKALDLFSKSNNINKIVLIDPLDDELIKINMPSINMPSIKMPGFSNFDIQKIWNTFENPIDLINLDDKIEKLYNSSIINEKIEYKPTNKELTSQICADCNKYPCECELNKGDFKEKKVLIIRTSEGNKWNFPPSIPPVGLLNLKNEKIEYNFNEVIINNFGHFDIFDDAWSSIVHNSISKGSNDRNSETLDKYRESLSRSINTFLNHD